MSVEFLPTSPTPPSGLTRTRDRRHEVADCRCVARIADYDCALCAARYVARPTRACSTSATRPTPRPRARRRQCGACLHRFTTYERPETSALMVVKSDHRRQEWNPDKLRRACRWRAPSARSAPRPSSAPSSRSKPSCARRDAAEVVELDDRRPGHGEAAPAGPGGLHPLRLGLSRFCRRLVLRGRGAPADRARQQAASRRRRHRRARGPRGDPVGSIDPRSHRQRPTGHRSVRSEPDPAVAASTSGWTTSSWSSATPSAPTSTSSSPPTT